MALGAVKPDFYQHLSEREMPYPTGIAKRVVNPAYPNVAIPHTVREFVNVRMLVPIRQQQPVAFANKLAPNQCFNERFLFKL